ncbi:NLR family CARD domain-containing protein 4-like isoform X2 [Montipora foliosa]|uniref:NLR family CARD domain-containing protein 4-like isoform X2 n=1 Tax=Montipora foliosa TaxID=591990 RepID=UPI0035F1E305
MASAAPSFSSTKETTNYARLCRLLVDVGTQALRDAFDRIHPPSRLHGILASTSPAHPTLQSLRKRKILNVTQWGKLYPTIPSSVSSASFDITLLMVLLRNICGLGAPASTGSWDILPPASDNSIEANIARIKYYRNNVYGHATQASIDEPTFDSLWLDISNALLALGSAASYTSAISRLKTECMDPDFEEHYRELLKEWKKDDDSTKDNFERLEVGKKRTLCLAVPEDCYGMPPQLSVKPPKLNDLPNTSKPWRCADLPIDVLLLTVEDCEFLSCFSFLDQPFKSYNIEVGPIYFGYTGNADDQKKLKVALMKCSKGAAVPGGSLTAVKNAVRTLRPKAVFSVGTCSGLSSDKIKLGDVVVSSKLTTPAGFKTPVSRHLGSLVRDAHCGWIAPLENRDELEVKVHCDGDILSQTQAVKCGWDDLHFQYPEAIAVETEGEGVFAAAYDEKVEWVVVKGVASYVNQTQLSRSEWMSFASTMAASVVANMLNDPVVFQEWPHCNQEMLKTQGVHTQDQLKEIQEMQKTQGVHTQDKLKEFQETVIRKLETHEVHSQGKLKEIQESFSEDICRAKLQEHYKRTSKVRTSSWSRLSLVDIDQVYTRLSVIQRQTTLAGSKQSEIAHYSDLFSPISKRNNPKRILVQGETGIGKSTFAKRLAIDWARLGNTQTDDKQAAVLERFKLVVFVNLKEVSKCQSLKDVIYNSGLFAREDKWLVEGLLNYITNHQYEVLLLLDGYDEYHSGQESQIFDIFSGKELRDCCVLMTSRISKAGELQEFQDLLAEITGFSDEDKLTYITRQLGDKRDARDLYDHLEENELLGLAKVPLLLLFFCTLWKKKHSEGLSKAKTSLYLKIVQHVLSHNQGKNTSPRFSRVEDNSEILNQIGKLALECLLNDDHIFPYGKLSSEVLYEDSVVIGLLQVTEFTESLQPTEMVSFIHKSIQEFLAAWYVTHKCIPDGNLGLIEEHTQTLESCREFENVLRFICGLSDEGAAKVFDHLKSVRINDPSLDISEEISNEDHKYKPLIDVFGRHKDFSDLVFYCFEDVQSKETLAKICVECFDGITVISEPPSCVALLFSGVNSWTFIFNPCFLFLKFKDALATLYKVVETVNFLDAPMKITENSENVPLGEFLRKFLDVECEECGFSSILDIHDGDVSVYFRDLVLNCDAHARLFTESAQAVALPCQSVSLVPQKTSLKFLSTFISGMESNAMKDFGAVIKNCTHLMSIDVLQAEDSVCEFLQQLPNPSKCDLKLTCKLMSKGTEELAELLPSFENITGLCILFDEWCAEKAIMRLVSSITHKSLVHLSLLKIHLTPAVAAALGRSFQRLSSLQFLYLHGTGDSLNVEDMFALFDRIDKDMPLKWLTFTNVSVSGSLSPLTRKLCFFPHLTWLDLEHLYLNENDLQDLEMSFSDVPNLHRLSLSGNALDHVQKPLASFLMKLGKIKYFNCIGCKLSRETLRILQEALPHLFIYSENSVVD